MNKTKKNTKRRKKAIFPIFIKFFSFCKRIFIRILQSLFQKLYTPGPTTWKAHVFNDDDDASVRNREVFLCSAKIRRNFVLMKNYWKIFRCARGFRWDENVGILFLFCVSDNIYIGVENLIIIFIGNCTGIAKFYYQRILIFSYTQLVYCIAQRAFIWLKNASIYHLLEKRNRRCRVNQQHENLSGSWFNEFWSSRFLII